MIKLLTSIFKKSKQEKKPNKPFEIVEVHSGNGITYHGFENPLDCRWLINGDRAVCSVCGKTIEKQYKEEDYV